MKTWLLVDLAKVQYPYDHEVPIVCINEDNTNNEIYCTGCPKKRLPFEFKR